MEMLYNTRELSVSQRFVRETAISFGKDAIAKNEFSDYYMLIAAIEAYKGEDGPYKCVDRLISQKTHESDVIAINILVLATWLIRIDKASKFGYDIEGGNLTDYAEFIIRGILDDTHENLRRDYYVTFSDAFVIGETVDHEEMWFKESVFEHILHIVISQYIEDQTVFDENDGCFSKGFEHLSLYPCQYNTFCKKVLAELKFDPTRIVETIREIYIKEDAIINKVRAAKLLILFSDIQYDERKTIVKEIEHSAKDIKVRQRLKNDDLEKAFLLSVKQIKEYSPEGENLIESLDLSSFSMDPEILLSKQNDEMGETRGIISDATLASTYLDDNVDYYALGRYEEAKKQYLEYFDILSSRNNLAYMLRRGEIHSVIHEGISYSVEDLLKDGIAAQEPYSLINYALHIAWNKDHYNYNTGLVFLMQYRDTSPLLSAASWWYKLRREGEAEGYVVLMWLCDMDLGLSGTKEELEVAAKKKFIDLIKF